MGVSRGLVGLAAALRRGRPAATTAVRALAPLAPTASAGFASLVVASRVGSRSTRALAATGAIGARAINTDALKPSDTFERRHNAVTDAEAEEMARVVGFPSVSALISATVPESIVRSDGMPLDVGGSGLTESQWLARAKALSSKNVPAKSYLGQGYYDTVLPPVILRNVLENPGWYTQYTPYQAEIAQGRLEVLLAFQTVVSDLVGLPLANASLLDEATSAAEAMGMCKALSRGKKTVFLVSSAVHPQTLAVCRTRAPGLGMRVETFGSQAELEAALSADAGKVAGVLTQYPDTNGVVVDPRPAIEAAKAAGAKAVVASDLLALARLTPPGELGADVVVGSAQRFGVPLGFGGPHAGFFACADEHKRLMPGRIIGVSRDARGEPALRMALQTREQHIRRDKATSNICTAQALLANLAALYAVYHGPQGVQAIADRVAGLAQAFAHGVQTELGATLAASELENASFFDTVAFSGDFDAPAVAKTLSDSRRLNLRVLGPNGLAASFGESTTLDDVRELVQALKDAIQSQPQGSCAPLASLSDEALASLEAPPCPLPASLTRSSPYLTHPLFSTFHAEHEMLRYLKRLENRDLSLAHAMIPLGSCTMKLNATSEMAPITDPGFAAPHPFAPRDQVEGYEELAGALSAQLASITGFAAVSLQPNSGAAGEYAGLLTIRAYHASRGQADRDVCLIPVSAHGTNPASAAMAGMRVVPVPVLADGSIDVAALRAKAAEHADKLAALMVTYPSTVGIYEDGIREVCSIVHEAGGQVYMDGANMNAQVGLTAPGVIGADVCHLNLHKTFCIPHGGGGPGVGPICVAKHLAPFLPSHPTVPTGGLPGFGVGADQDLLAAKRDAAPGSPLAEVLAPLSDASAAALAAVSSDAQSLGAVAAAPLGSASILPISHGYISMMGSDGLKKASERAILAANYMAARLGEHYKVLYAGANGTVAHEFILDLRPLTATTGVDPEDVAKRLIDYGFHAPTMSWPVAGTLMVEPTESESKRELDRFVDAMVAIREEIREIEEGKADMHDNVLKNAPHTAKDLTDDAWNKPYSRETAAFPTAHVKLGKFWPSVNRVDNVYGDRTLVTKLPEDLQLF